METTRKGFLAVCSGAITSLLFPGKAKAKPKFTNRDILPHQRELCNRILTPDPPTPVQLSGDPIRAPDLERDDNLLDMLQEKCQSCPGVRIVVVDSNPERSMGNFFGLFETTPHLDTKINCRGRTITYPNKSLIRFKSYDDPDKVRAWEAHVVAFPDLGSIGGLDRWKRKIIVQRCIERLRCNKPDYTREVWADCDVCEIEERLSKSSIFPFYFTIGFRLIPKTPDGLSLFTQEHPINAAGLSNCPSTDSDFSRETLEAMSDRYLWRL